MRWLRFIALLVLTGWLVILARADISTPDQILPGIAYHSESRAFPPTRLFIAEVDLKNPQLHVRVASGGVNPDGAGHWQTTLTPPTEIAAREHFDLVVNGDFFAAEGVKDAEGKPAPYRSGQRAQVLGPAMTDGKAWSAGEEPRPCLVLRRGVAATIETVIAPPPDAWEVVGGNPLLIKDGVDVAPRTALKAQFTARHPRTAVGLDASGTKLTILVVNGREPGLAIGMDYEELAHEMLQLGCKQALNLDGGGSSLLAIRAGGRGEMKILNQPTDGHERAVADVLGISVGR